MTTPITKLHYSTSTVGHLKKYPVLVEIDGFVKSFDFLKSWIAFVDQYVSAIADALEYEFLIKSYNRLDTAFDKYILTGLIDKYLPALSTFKFTDSYASVKKYLFDTYEAVKKYFADLYTTGTEYAKGQYSKGLDYSKSQYETGKDKFKTQYDKLSARFYKKANDYKTLAQPRLESISKPVLKPINNNVEYLISNYLPKENGSVTSNGSTTPNTDSELQRSMNLLSVSYSRGKPIVEKITSLPSDFSKHVSDVYSSEKTEDVSAALALAKASRRLSDEALSSLKPTVNKLTSSFSSSKLDKLQSEIHSAGETILHEAELLQDNFDSKVNGNATPVSAIPVN